MTLKGLIGGFGYCSDMDLFCLEYVQFYKKLHKITTYMFRINGRDKTYTHTIPSVVKHSHPQSQDQGALKRNVTKFEHQRFKWNTKHIKYDEKILQKYYQQNHVKNLTSSPRVMIAHLRVNKYRHWTKWLGFFYHKWVCRPSWSRNPEFLLYIYRIALVWIVFSLVHHFGSLEKTHRIMSGSYNDNWCGAIFDPRAMIVRIYVVLHMTLHNKHRSFGFCGFREEDFIHVLQL